MTLKELSNLDGQMRDACRRLSMTCLPRSTEEVNDVAIKIGRGCIMGGNGFWAAFVDRRPGTSIHIEAIVNNERVLMARLPPESTLEEAAEMAEILLKMHGIELVDE